MIIWAVKRHRLLLAKLLSKAVRLELEIEKSSLDMTTNWRVRYGKECLAKTKRTTLFSGGDGCSA
jgi:hypothetical protein